MNLIKKGKLIVFLGAAAAVAASLINDKKNNEKNTEK